MIGFPYGRDDRPSSNIHSGFASLQAAFPSLNHNRRRSLPSGVLDLRGFEAPDPSLVYLINGVIPNLSVRLTGNR